jgi:hypothetical protein
VYRKDVLGQINSNVTIAKISPFRYVDEQFDLAPKGEGGKSLTAQGAARYELLFIQ